MTKPLIHSLNVDRNKSLEVVRLLLNQSENQDLKFDPEKVYQFDLPHFLPETRDFRGKDVRFYVEKSCYLTAIYNHNSSDDDQYFEIFLARPYYFVGTLEGKSKEERVIIKGFLKIKFEDLETNQGMLKYYVEEESCIFDFYPISGTYPVYYDSFKTEEFQSAIFRKIKEPGSATRVLDLLDFENLELLPPEHLEKLPVFEVTLGSEVLKVTPPLLGLVATSQDAVEMFKVVGLEIPSRSNNKRRAFFDYLDICDNEVDIDYLNLGKNSELSVDNVVGFFNIF